jgi:acyl carrier protein
MAAYQYVETAEGSTSVLGEAETSTLLTNEIGKKLFDFLLKAEEDLNISRTLANLGMDSLVAIEMRSWWKQAFGFDISVLRC